MKKIVIFIFILATALTTMAQATQPCVVKQYNGKQAKTPLSGVRVHVDGAQTATSGNDGRFTLTFLTLKPGDHIRNASAMKPGYEIFNMSAVEQWNISRSNTPFILVLVKSEEFKQLKGKLTQTSTDTYRAKYEQAVQDLERQKKEGKLKEEEYNKKYDELDARYQEQLKNLDNYIDQFARIDLSEVSAEEQHILDMMQEGKLEEALKAYAELRLVEKFGSEAETYLAEHEAMRRLEEDMEGRKSNIDQLYEAVLREVNALILAEKEKEAEERLLSLLDKLTPLFSNTPDEFRPKLAKVHAQLGDVASSSSNAIEHWSAAVNEYAILTKQNPDLYLADLSEVQFRLGCYYTIYLEGNPKGEEFLQAAIRNYKILFRQAPNQYRYRLLLAINELGKLHESAHRLSQAEQLYIEAIELIPPTEQDTFKSSYFSALVYYNLANLYANKLHSLDKAEEAYLMSLKATKRLALDDIKEYGVMLKERQHTLFSFYLGIMGNKAKAGEFMQKEALFYLEQIDSLSQLFMQDPKKHEEKWGLFHECFFSYYYICLESSFTDRWDLYNDQVVEVVEDSPTVFMTDKVALLNLDFEKIENHYKKVLDNYSQLYQYNPEKYGEKYGEMLGEMAYFCFYYKKDITKAEEYNLMKLDTYTHLSQLHPEKFGVKLAEQLAEMGYYYHGYKNDSIKAERLFRQAEDAYLTTLDILTIKYKEDPMLYGELLAYYQKKMGDSFRYDMKDSIKAEKYYLMELETFAQMSQLNQEKYGRNLALQLEFMGNFYNYIDDDLDYLFHKAIDEKARKKAEECYLRAEKEYIQLAERDLLQYGKSLAEMQEALARFYENRMDDNAKVEEYYLKAENTYARLSELDLIGFGTWLVSMQKRLASFYHYTMVDKIKEEDYYLKALATYIRLFELAPDRYRSDLASLQIDIIRFYASNNKLDQYDAMLDAALANYEVLYQQDENSYFKSIIANLRNRKGWRCLQKGQTDEALALFESANQLDPEESAPYLASGYNAKAYEYAKAKDFTKAIETIDRSIALMPDEANYYDSKGEILLMMGDEQEAVKMWQKVVELNPDFLSDYGGESQLHKQLKEKGLIEE